MSLKKLSIIAILVSFGVISLLVVINAQNKPNPFSAYILGSDFEIEANKKTTIELHNIEGGKLFTLFDNILSRDQEIAFYIQPDFWEHKCENDSELALPLPLLESSVYFVRYISTDTVYTRKFVYMK
jgi:hypothetical protein